MPVKIRLQWKHDVPSTMTCLIKLLPDKFQTNVAKFGSVHLNIEEVING